MIPIESNLIYTAINALSWKISTLMTLTEISKIFMPREGFVKFQRSFTLGQQRVWSLDGIDHLDEGTTVVDD